MLVRFAVVAAALYLCLTPMVQAQDAVKADPKHYTVVSENDQVRILKVHYGAHEKSVMHSHPATVMVPLTDGKGQFNMADGKKQEFTAKAGEAQYSPAVTHLPENTGDKPFDLVLVELKGKTAKPSAGAAKPAKTEKTEKK
jgi:quercetin dioxygenase-like cupin family protein